MAYGIEECVARHAQEIEMLYNLDRKRTTSNVWGLTAKEDPIITFIDDVLEYEFRVASDGSFRGVILLLQMGGPTVEFDTLTRRVFGSWGLDEASRQVSAEAADFIASLFELDFAAVVR